MAEQRGWRFIASVRRVIHTDAASGPATEELTVVDEAVAVRILDLAMRIAETMLAVGASAREVTRTILSVCDAYRLTRVHADVAYTSITVSHHRSGDHWPTTILRVVRATVPDYAKLQRLQALVQDIESGLDLDDARARYRAIRRIPFLYRPTVVAVARAMLATGVSVLFGASWLMALLTFIAALAAAITQLGMSRLRVPGFFSQIVGAFVLTMVAVGVSVLVGMGVPLFEGIRPSLIVASGIVLMLAGLAVVGAAQDAIDGFALTAGGRVLDLGIQTLGVVLGILAGLEAARILGVGMELPPDSLELGPFPSQLIGAVVISIAVAVFNGSGPRIIVVSALLGLIAWLAFAAVSAGDLAVTAANGVGALAASFVGGLVARRLTVPVVAITTAAIVPLVPGAATFRGLLGLVNSDGTATALVSAADSLITAAMIGVGLAAGASLGLFLARATRSGFRAIGRFRRRRAITYPPAPPPPPSTDEAS